MPALHYLITPPGLIARARMYSLVSDADRLYILNTGLATNPTNLFLDNAPRHQVLAKVMQSKFDEEIFSAQKQIDAGDMATALAKKQSKQFPISEVFDMHIEDSAWKGHNLYVTAGGKKYRFVFHPSRQEEIQSFIATYR